MVWKMLVKQSAPPRNALPKRHCLNGEIVSGAVEKWCISSALKVWLSGLLSEFLFSLTIASKVGEKVFHTY